MTPRVMPLGSARLSRGGFAVAPKRSLQTMRAAVVSGPGKVEVVEAQVPKPNSNELLVRIEGCGVCASNIPPWEGKPWFTYPMAPGALGHEAWGWVKEIGDEVHDFQKGDRVAFLSNRAYADYDVCQSSSATKIPASLNGTPFPGEPLGCAMNIFSRSKIGKEHIVSIVGVGFLGALL